MSLIDILIPLYILISLGYILRKYQFPNTEFWPGIERMTYYILFPTLIFVALVKAEIDSSLLFKVAIVTLIPALVSSSIQWFGLLSPNISRATFSSMFQGALRNNTAISLVIADWMVPDRGLVIMAVIILIMVPMNNLASIYVLMRFGESNKEISISLWKSILSNPLIISCILGLFFNASGIGLPRSLLETADFLGRSALPFALLAVGAGLKFGTIFNNKLAISFSSLAKIIVTPLLSWSLCLFLGVESEIAKVAIIFSAMPTAVSSYILARQMGGDAESMAQIITFQTIAAAFTLPVFLLIAQSYG